MGNVAASFGVSTSCLTGVFLATQCQLQVCTPDDQYRWVSVDQSDFFPIARAKYITPTETITAVKVPAMGKFDVVRAYKQGLRHGQNERGLVNCAMWLRFDEHNGTIAKARLAFGGLYGAPILAVKAGEKLVGQVLTAEAAQPVLDVLAAECRVDQGDKPQYRGVLALSLFARFFAEARVEWEKVSTA